MTRLPTSTRRWKPRTRTGSRDTTSHQRKKTQEQFLRTGLVASQVNSAVVAIQGDHAEARKIQEEFGEETVLILEGTPIIGHAMSAGYAAGGDLDKAEQVKLELSKLAIRICFPV